VEPECSLDLDPDDHAAAVGAAAGDCTTTDTAMPVHRWLPAPAGRRRRARIAAAGAAAAAVTIAALLLGAREPPASSEPASLLAQYGYATLLPEGWAHTGGLPERRRTLLAPAAAPAGSDLIIVESTSLGYDAGAEPERAAVELRAVFDAAVATGAPLSDFTPSQRYAGRTVTSYRERGAATVEWYVLLDGDTQLSVGCQHTAAGAEQVRQACTVVVGSVRRR